MHFLFYIPPPSSDSICPLHLHLHHTSSVSCLKGTTIHHNTPLHIPKLLYRVYKPRISIYLSPEPSPVATTFMAQEQPASLPVYYGERMPDGTVIESPRVRPVVTSDSRDALLRLPIQPGEAHVNSGIASPISPMVPVEAVGGNGGPPGPPARPRGNTMPDSSRWVTYPAGDQGEDYPPNRRSNRYGPSEYRGSMSRRAPYVEDYSDGEDYPRATRRANRRHTRPPSAHGRVSGTSGRYSNDLPRSSFDSRVDYGYESDTPRKARFVRYSDEEGFDDEPRRPQAYAGGGGRRGPPRAPSTEEVMRLPWTMWMNSNAKNRRSPRSLHRLRGRPLPPSTSGPLQGISLDDGESHSMIPTHLSRRILIIS
jgi:hypothetical protein